MTIEDQIRDEKLQYDIKREAAKISALSSGKYEYLTGEETLPSNQQQVTEQAKRKGNKSAEHKKTLANINLLFNSRNNAIKFIEDYAPMILEAKRLVKQEEQDLKY